MVFLGQVAVYVVWKRMAFDFTPTAMHRVPADADETPAVPADNLDAIFNPYKIGSERVQVAGAHDVYKQQVTINKKGTTHEYKDVVAVKHSWVLFGEGVPAAEMMHTPSRSGLRSKSLLHCPKCGWSL